MERIRRTALLLTAALAGCSLLPASPTALPPSPTADTRDAVGTAIALTYAYLNPPTATWTATVPPTPVPDTVTPSATITQTPDETQTLIVALSASPTLSPTRTLSPTPTLTYTRTITYTPTITPTRTPRPPTLTPTVSESEYRADIEFVSLGPMSKVVSPIPVRAFVRPGYRDQVRLELIGEDGRLIARKVVKAYAGAYPWVYIDSDLPFEIRAAAELARLQIVSEDRYGRVRATGALHVLLLSDGENELTPRLNMIEPFFVEVPRPWTPIYGGTMIVRGAFTPLNLLPLTVELVTREGQVLITRQVAVTSLERQPFTLLLPYNVSGPLLLVARQSDPRIEGAYYLFSSEFNVLP